MNDNITASDATPGDVLIQLSYPQSTLDGQRARIVITDQMSGLPLAAVDLTPEQLMSFMSATGTQVSGAVLPKRPELIGRRRQATSTSLGRNDDRTPEQIRDAYLADGWETADIQPTNYGTRVVARRWVTDEQSKEA
jgi:hypothetical protein